MKKLTSLVGNLQQDKRIALVETHEQYVQYVHEHLKQFEGYSLDAANQMCESLLEASQNNFQKALNELKNFQMHG